MPPLFAPRTAFALLLAAAVAILGTALASQYLGGLQPCDLCLWQRYPYAVLIGVAGVGFGLSRVPGAPRGLLTGLLGTAALLMTADSAIAVFHVGVEHHWWQGLASCSGPTGAATTVEALARQLNATPVVRCDEIAWSFAGISMAGYNIVASALLAVFAALATRAACRRTSDTGRNSMNG